jgi:hypothetical protein
VIRIHRLAAADYPRAASEGRPTLGSRIRYRVAVLRRRGGTNGHSPFAARKSCAHPGSLSSAAVSHPLVGIVPHALGWRQRGIGVVVADIVTTRQAIMHNELIELIDVLRLDETYRQPPDVFLAALAYRPAHRAGQDQTDSGTCPCKWVGQCLCCRWLCGSYFGRRGSLTIRTSGRLRGESGNGVGNAVLGLWKGGD